MIKLNIELEKDFFNEEERSGYLVSCEMKELWGIELDLLSELDRVCKKHDIKYFVLFGTLLGAVRHKGFIPWDDDIDVAMDRDNYEKLLKVYDEFKEPYFLQNDYLEPGSHTYFAKLRRTDTTAILKTEPEFTFNQGVFIDIFVMDNIPESDSEMTEFRNKLGKVKNLSLYWSRAYDTKSFHSKYKPLVVLVYGTKWFIKLFNIRNPFLRRYDKLCMKYRNMNTSRFAVLEVSGKVTMDKSWFDETIYLDFENMKVPCPKEFKNYLESRYGNWEVFEIGTQIHDVSLLDTRKSYMEYI